MCGPPQCREHINRQPALRQPPAEVELVDMSPEAGRRSGGHVDDSVDNARCGKSFHMSSGVEGRLPTATKLSHQPRIQNSCA